MARIARGAKVVGNEVQYQVEVVSLKTLRKRATAIKRFGFSDEEIYKETPDGLQVGLVSMTLKQLKDLNITTGRRNEIKNAMRDWNMSRDEAIEWAQRRMLGKSYELGNVGDYIEYYYYA